MNRLPTILKPVLAVLALSILPGLVAAQTPTAAQMELFRQLPPAEQQRLMREYGIQGPAATVPDQGAERAVPRERDERERAREREWDTFEQERRAPRTVTDPATGLPLFGYDLFHDVPSTFAPVTDIPVPVDYVLGPGDVLQVQLMGRTPGFFTLTVNRDGSINFPELGPIQVAGLSFDEARRLLQDRVAQQMIGVTASVTMGELRSIRVFVLGDAERPGSYTVSSLSTITNALFASGGIRPIGSLRNIELKRDGATVGTLDLYDLLLRGDTRNDARLQPGDVIFIPPVGSQAGVDGEVRRPGVYELKGPTTADELVGLAGGLASSAFPQGALLSRINEDRERIIEDVDLRAADGRARRIRAGDLLEVPSVLDRVDNAVQLSGHVYRPMQLQYRPGMRLSDLVRSLSELRPLADANYVLIRRELAPDRRIFAVSADLAAALAAPGSMDDIELRPRDQVYVFSLVPVEKPEMENGLGFEADRWVTPEEKAEREKALKADRRTVVNSLLDELRVQSSFDEAAPIVRVDGRVRAPGLYPLEPGMRVSDLLRAGGRLAESAYVLDAEVTRYEVIDGQYREAELINLDLAAVRAGDSLADLVLQPYDFLHVKEVTNWREQESVTLVGEVRFPGTYPIRRGETLLSVIERAGGLTDRAYADGAVFTREQLKERERRQAEELANRMEADLAALALQGAQAGGAQGTAETIAAGRSLLAELRQAQPVGRLAMELPRILTASIGSADDLVLQDGDTLMVPGSMQSITVLGEVHSPASILHRAGLTRDDYINQSGGMTRRADASRVYVVRANGMVIASGSRRWFQQSASAELRPGDTIVVPADIERMRPLPLWTAVTTIIYNMAVAVAAVNSF